MLDPDDLELIRASAADPTDPARMLRITVSGCAYSCCGRPWIRRDGYEQQYRGYINDLDEEPPQITFLLVSPGLGTVGYWCAIRESEIVGVELAPIG